jgi:membrane protein involved in colicin uptake
MKTFDDLQGLLTQSQADAKAYGDARDARVKATDTLNQVTQQAADAVKTATGDQQDAAEAESKARDTLDADRQAAHAAIDDVFNTLTAAPASSTSDAGNAATS